MWTMVDYDHAFVRYPYICYISFLFALHIVNYRFSLVWGFLFFIAFVHVAYGRLQILTSVGLSFLSLLSALYIVDYRLSLVWGFPFLIIFVHITWSITDFSLVWGLLRLAPIILNQKNELFSPRFRHSIEVFKVINQIKTHGSESRGQEEAACMRVFWPTRPLQ